MQSRIRLEARQQYLEPTRKIPAWAMESLSASLKRDISMHIYRKPLLQLPMFLNLSEKCITAIAMALEPVQFAAYQTIFHEDEKGDCVYFLHSGDAGLWLFLKYKLLSALYSFTLWLLIQGGEYFEHHNEIICAHVLMMTVHISTCFSAPSMKVWNLDIAVYMTSATIGFVEMSMLLLDKERKERYGAKIVPDPAFKDCFDKVTSKDGNVHQVWNVASEIPHLLFLISKKCKCCSQIFDCDLCRNQVGSRPWLVLSNESWHEKWHETLTLNRNSSPDFQVALCTGQELTLWSIKWVHTSLDFRKFIITSQVVAFPLQLMCYFYYLPIQAFYPSTTS